MRNHDVVQRTMVHKPLKEILEGWELCNRCRYDIYVFTVDALGIKST